VTQPYTINESELRPKVEATTYVDSKKQTQNYKYEQFFTTDPKDIYRPHMSAGLGLKIGMNENFVLSADWAMPVNESYYMYQDNGKLSNFYVKMGYLF